MVAANWFVNRIKAYEDMGARMKALQLCQHVQIGFVVRVFG